MSQINVFLFRSRNTHTLIRNFNNCLVTLWQSTLTIPLHHQNYFIPSHLYTAFWAITASWINQESSQFCPPVCYQLSQAEISSLLRNHLPPHITNLTWVSSYKKCLNQIRWLQGFPRYYKLPVKNSILNHAMSLTKYWASRYFARLPTHNAESGLHYIMYP